MRLLPVATVIIGLFAALTCVPRAVADAEQNADTIKFAVVRNGDDIGSHTITIRRSATETLVEISTRVEVKIAFFTAYRFLHREDEHWVKGRLLSLTSVTDDNGTPHKVNASANADGVTIEADGKVNHIEGNIVPASFWNASIVHQKVALNTQNGSLMPVSVDDAGMEQLTIQGTPRVAHHYLIRTTYAQDVWYDDAGRILKAQFRGSDGSTIWYRLI